MGTSFNPINPAAGPERSPDMPRIDGGGSPFHPLSRSWRSRLARLHAEAGVPGWRAFPRQW